MRDLLVAGLVFGALPFVLTRPFLGIVVWTWLSLMNPHRLAWGFATGMPFAQLTFLALAFAFFTSKERKRVPITPEVVVLGLFIAWMFVTTTQALWPNAAWAQWDKVWKIQLVILFTLMLTTTPQRIQILVWTIAVSLGFYGIKGGIWIILSGGAHRVYGPQGTFIGGNNEIGLALIMTVPLLWYLIQTTEAKRLRLGLYGALFLTLVSIIGTHSRGAFLGLAVMGLFFLVKSKRKLVPLVLAAGFVAAVPYVVPQSWFDRMETIQNYEQDHSARERLRAWRNAIQLASIRPLGGGYEALVAYGGRDAHSIYFEVLGEHGFVGLGLFLALGWLTWMRCRAIRKRARGRPELRWAGELASMIQVSLAGYAAAGAFLGLAYFDFYYTLIAVAVVTWEVITRRQEVSVPAGGPVRLLLEATRPLPAAALR